MRRLFTLALLLFGLWVVIHGLRPPLVRTIAWSTAVYDQDGNLLRLTLSADDKYRLVTPLKDFPPALVEAILFKEDRYFRLHPGINPIALARAFVQTYWTGGRRIGGSTISMQLARLKYHIVSHSLRGKIKQILHALWLESFYAKDEILEAYLNLLPYGGNVEGAGTASLIYFAKAPNRLNLPEMLTLAVVPQSPKLRSVGSRGEILAGTPLMQARDRFFAIWSKEHAVTSQDRLSLGVPLRLRGTKDLPFLAPHFATELLRARGGQGGGTIQSTLKRRLQSLLERKLEAYINRQKVSGVRNAAALLVDWRTHEVKASVGSVDFFNDEIQGQVNLVKARRSPGSTLKPFVYALAFDQGLIHPQSILKDVAVSYPGFDPENFDRDFQGPISAEQALIRSRNLPAVQISALLKNPTFFEFLTTNGIAADHEASYYGLSPVLGGLEVSMEDLVRLYAMLPNWGHLQGLKREKSETISEQGQPLSAEASYAVLDILKKLPRPPSSGGSPWSSHPLEVYWKTGTSQGFRDAWTVGIFGPYVLAVWLGNFSGQANPALIGIEMAAPLFFEIAEAINGDEKLPSSLRPPANLNIKSVAVCAVSGQLPGPHCQHKKSTLFIPGKSPIQTCDVHREILVSRQTGLRLCPRLAQEGVAQVFEFWPSDLLKLFASAGLPRRSPPAWDPRCPIADLATNGAPPQIVSPKTDVIYSLRGDRESAERLALSAVADADVRETFWFIDETFVGQSRPREPLFWPLRSGKHWVRVVDDQGRSDSRPLVVQVSE